jgi:hypothetical protein
MPTGYSDARRMDLGTRVPQALLGQAPGGHAEEDPMKHCADPYWGDVVVALLGSTLAGLRDRLASDNYEAAAELVADLVEITDDYLTRIPDRSRDA